MTEVEPKTIPVTVVVRCRPLVRKELNEGSKIVVEFDTAFTQISLPDVRKSFTFDHVFPPDSRQDEVYKQCGQRLIQSLFKGYNATILAYGQTGSGKTFTMGTAYSETVCPDDLKGIIPRVVTDIFHSATQKSDSHICALRVSFLEVYNESIYDLFSPGDTKEVHIREDFNGIKIVGVKELPVENAKDVLKHLEQGTSNRKTGSTNMNESSSRSHAIFTLSMEQRSKADPDDCSTSKFHLVDLAGSERAKKTGAQGTRFREGVNINKGLLALGNVISALCDGNSHIPYRDSKLTRLLQDSLGGNSYTAMVACVSPADSNLEETLNTLRYADRARKIKNKPIVNKDPRLREIEELKKSVIALQIQWSRHMVMCPLKDEILAAKEEEEANQDGLEVSMPYETLSVPLCGYNGESDEDKSLTKNTPTINCLKKRLEMAEEENRKMEEELKRSMKQIAGFCGRMICAEGKRERMKSQFKYFAEHYEDVFKEVGSEDLVKSMKDKLAPMINETLEAINLPTPNPKPQILNSLAGPDGAEPSSDDNDVDASSKRLEMSVAISKELEDVEDNLQMKEMILYHYENTKDQRDEKTQEEKARVKQLRSQIEKLEKQKEDEISIEVPPTAKNPAAKMSEERRKKIKTLELEISNMRKEMAEKTKLLSAKKEQEKRMKELEKEIKELKSARVSLMRKMQSESKRVTEMQRKIKTQDAKYQNEQHKAKMLLNKNKEENAQLVRKLKAAQSAKQRLEASLSKQKALANDRALFRGKARGNFSDRIKAWLNQEIDVEANRLEARKHIEVLKENRAKLAEEIEALQDQLEELSESPAKKRVSGNTTFDLKEVDSSDTLKKRLEIEQEMSRVKRSMEEFTSSIREIHHDMLTGSDDLTLNEKNRWNELTKVNEYQCALSFLFEMVLQQASKNNDLSREVGEAQANYVQIKEELTECGKKMKKVQKESEITIRNLTDDFNIKMISLMDEVSGITKVKDESGFGLDPLINTLRRSLKEKADEVEHLQTELGLAKAKELDPKTKTKRLEKKVILEDYVFIPSDDETEDEDDEADPMWVKTPAQMKKNRRTILGTKLNPNKENKMKVSDKEATNAERKRLTSAGFCSCKGACKTNHCGCRKGNRSCGINCKCAKDCWNMSSSSDNDLDMLDEPRDTAINTTFMTVPVEDGSLNTTFVGIPNRRSPRCEKNLSQTPCPYLDISRLKTDESFFAPVGLK